MTTLARGELDDLDSAIADAISLGGSRTPWDETDVWFFQRLDLLRGKISRMMDEIENPQPREEDMSEYRTIGFPVRVRFLRLCGQVGGLDILTDANMPLDEIEFLDARSGERLGKITHLDNETCGPSV